MNSVLPTTPSCFSPATMARRPLHGRTAATPPFRGEKGTTFEGGIRVPMIARWPGVIKPDTIVNDMMANEDWLPTLLAAAGESDVKEKLFEGNEGG